MKFSIILPTYNRANLVGRAIESVLRQTYPNWELIIIDDGSTDNTKEVLKKFQKRFCKLNEKLRNKTLKKIDCFKLNQFEKSLNNHKLI